MNEWRLIKIEAIASKTNNSMSTGPFGSSIGSQFFQSTGIPLIRGSNLSQNVSQKLIEDNYVFVSEEKANEFERSKVTFGDLIFTCWGTINQVGLIHSNTKFSSYLISNKQMKLTLDKSVADNIFYYYYFSSPLTQEYILGSNIGSSVPGFNLGQLKTMEVPFPPLSEQKAIAAVLSSLDDKIDLLHRQNKTLEAMAETLFRQWFVEEADEGWEEGTFENWIVETVGGEWGKEYLNGDYSKIVNCIRGTDIADLNNGIPAKTPVRFVKENKYDVIRPREGDIILEISGGTESQSTGRTCYINKQIQELFSYPVVFSNFCRMVRVKKTEYSFFLFCYFQYLYKRDEFFSLENGSSGIKNLNYKVLLFDTFFPMPDEKKVINFHYQIKPLFNKIEQNKLQIRTLEKLRDSLLPKLMSGEVRVQL